MTDLDLYTGLPPVQVDPTGGRLVAWAQAAHAAHSLATSLCKTTFAPKDFRGKPEDATAAIMLGDELGLSPLSALRSVYVIHGTPSIYARTMVALAQAHGHDVWTEESSESRVTVCGQRKGSQHVESSTWTMDRARKAGYTTNAKYQSNPQEMLWAKAASEVCKKIASDVLAGVPLAVEDLELDPENQPTARVSRLESGRTRVRRQRPETPEPPLEEPQEALQAVPSERADQPADDGTADPEPPITDAQMKKLHAALRDAGITDRDAGLAYISQEIDRDIASTKELTKREASAVIDSLGGQPTTPEPEFS